MLDVAPHPLLDLCAFVTRFAAPLGDLSDPPGDAPRPAAVAPLLDPAAAAPLGPDDAVRKAVRDLLRHGGFKPTGRNKPASEYLLRAAEAGRLATINPAVDAGNAVSLHSGLPVSVVDVDRTTGPLRVAIADPGTSYVFNPAGQIIDVSGLLCLFDGDGPCANAVKDAQRTKTDGGTRRTLSIVWGTTALPGRADAATRWFREIITGLGGEIEDVA